MLSGKKGKTHGCSRNKKAVISFTVLSPFKEKEKGVRNVSDGFKLEKYLKNEKLK